MIFIEYCLSNPIQLELTLSYFAEHNQRCGANQHKILIFLIFLLLSHNFSLQKYFEIQ